MQRTLAPTLLAALLVVPLVPACRSSAADGGGDAELVNDGASSAGPEVTPTAELLLTIGGVT